MQYFVQTLLLTLSLGFVGLSSHANSNDYATENFVAKRVIDLGELPTGRPAKITLWFPEGQCSEQAQKNCLSDSAITDRTLVLSHGAMGAAENYNWLAESLAASGYIVVGINHYGESWLYGEASQDVKATSVIWQRPMDISAIYDALSNREIFQRKINWSNVIALGHSSGGQTVAMLAGAQYDLLAMAEFCKMEAAQNDHSCDYGIRKMPVPGESFLKTFSQTHLDPRVKKIILLDPTLGYGATPKSLATIQRPTLVIGSQKNDFLPWENHGALYTKYIPNARAHLLTGEEGHFVFLDKCTNDVAVMGVPLCHDRAGVDRSATHAALAPVILDFVREDNIQIDPPKQFAEKKKALINTSKIPQMLIYTPRWVFGLLAGLIVLGLTQVRTRKISIKVAFILPIAMMLMSVSSTVVTLGLSWITILFWLLGAVSITALILKFSAASSVTLDRTTGKLIVPGSWIPLLVIMAIFLTKYVLGYSVGTNSTIVHSVYFKPVMSLLLGSLSGYFIARGINYRRISRL